MRKYLLSKLILIKSDKVFLVVVNLISYIFSKEKKVKLIRFNNRWSISSKHLMPHRNRFLFYIKGLDNRLQGIKHEYLTHLVPINKGDCVIDCGANNGDFGISMIQSHEASVIFFEPGLIEFECLTHNLAPYSNTNLYHLALSNKSGILPMYMDSENGDNSLEKYSTFKNKIDVEVKKADEISVLRELESCKLFKIEAEGHEPEILLGSTELLKKTEYVTIDAGFERGVNQESTMPAVVKIMHNNGFVLVANGRERLVLLFKNKMY